MNFISRAWADTTTAIIMSQATMVILTAFGGGIFIPWDKTPDYWVWLQELSIFTQASRAAITHMNNNIIYTCQTPGPDFLCRAYGKIIDCDAQASNKEFCLVKGRTVMNATQGTSMTDSPWIAFGYLVLIFAAARLGVLILMYYPSDKIIAFLRRFFSTGVQEQLNEVQLKNRNFEGTELHNGKILFNTRLYELSLLNYEFILLKQPAQINWLLWWPNSTERTTVTKPNS